MTFPAYETWLAQVIHPRERIATRNSPWCFESPAWHRFYRGKHDLAQTLHPERILEIGVRYGYSAHAFLSAFSWGRQPVFVGIDSNDPAHNAMGEPTLHWAHTMLTSTIPGATIELHTVNTRLRDFRSAIPGFVADLTHIDADHSYHGALDDMAKAWDVTARAMLVDDYLGCPSVHDAVDAFVRSTGAHMLTSPQGFGEALLLKNS